MEHLLVWAHLQRVLEKLLRLLAFVVVVEESDDMTRSDSEQLANASQYVRRSVHRLDDEAIHQFLAACCLDSRSEVGAVRLPLDEEDRTRTWLEFRRALEDRC